MPRNRGKVRNKAAAEDGGKPQRRKTGGRGNARGPNGTRQRVVSEDDPGAGTTPFFDVFHYKPTLEDTDYHLFRRLRFYILPDHSLRRRPGLGYVRLYDLISGAEPLPGPVELSCGVFACLAPRPDIEGDGQWYPDQSVVQRALETGQFARCVDFRQYLETMWQSEHIYWERQKQAVKVSPIQQTMQEIFHSVAEPVRDLDSGEMCERLALTEQSYSEDAGQRCSLVLPPELPAVTADTIYSGLHRLLERTFELFVEASGAREVPRLLPRGRSASQDGSEEEEWIGATQMKLSASAEDLLTSSPRNRPHVCPLDSCDGGGLSQSPQSGCSDLWDELLPFSDEEDDPELSRLLVRSLVTPGADPARQWRIGNALEGGARMLGRVLNVEQDRGRRRIYGTGRCVKRSDMEGGGKKPEVEEKRELRSEGGLGTDVNARRLDSTTASGQGNNDTLVTVGAGTPDRDPKPDGNRKKAKMHKKRKSLLKPLEQRLGGSSSSATTIKSVKNSGLISNQADPVTKSPQCFDVRQEAGSPYTGCNRLEDQAKTSALHSDSNDEEKDDESANWHFFQHYVTDGDAASTDPRSQEPKHNRRLSRRDEKLVSKQPVLEETCSENAMMVTHDSEGAFRKLEAEAEGDPRIKEASASHTPEDMPEQAAAGRLESTRRTGKAPECVSTTSEDGYELEARGDCADVALSTTKQRNISEIIQEEQISVNVPSGKIVFGANVSMGGEIVRIYVPREELRQLRDMEKSTLTTGTNQTAAKLDPSRQELLDPNIKESMTAEGQVYETLLHNSIRYTSGSGDPPLVVPCHPSPVVSLPVGLQGGSHHSRSCSSSEESTRDGQSRATSVEETNPNSRPLPVVSRTTTVPEPRKTVSHGEPRTVIQSQVRAVENAHVLRHVIQRSGASGEAAELYSQTAAEKNEGSVRKDTEVAVELLEAAINETDHAIRLTTSVLLLAIVENAGPLESMTHSMSQPVPVERSISVLTTSEPISHLCQVEEQTISTSDQDLATSSKSATNELDKQKAAAICAVDRAAERVAGCAVEKVSEEAAEQAVEQAADQAVGQEAELAAKLAAELAAERAAEQAIEQAAEQAAEKAAQRAAEQAAKQAVEQAAKQTVGQAAEQAHKQQNPEAGSLAAKTKVTESCTSLGRTMTNETRMPSSSIALRDGLNQDGTFNVARLMDKLEEYDTETIAAKVLDTYMNIIYNGADDSVESDRMGRQKHLTGGSTEEMCGKQTPNIHDCQGKVQGEVEVERSPSPTESNISERLESAFGSTSSLSVATVTSESDSLMTAELTTGIWKKLKVKLSKVSKTANLKKNHGE